MQVRFLSGGPNFYERAERRDYSLKGKVDSVGSQSHEAHVK